MSSHTVVLLGGPDSGQTNYLVRLWRALKSRKAVLMAPRSPENIKYVESLIEYILRGQFVPHTDLNVDPAHQQLEIPIVKTAAPEDGEVTLEVPDVSGELWQRAIDHGEVPRAWMEALEVSRGALLFVRVDSKANVSAMDWVNNSELLRFLGKDVAPNPGGVTPSVPTQVALCEMLRFLDQTLVRTGDQKPRVSVMITAWDLLNEVTAAEGPEAYLASEYPLFSGRLRDCSSLDVRCFGVSIVGGDLNEQKFQEEFFENEVDEMGFVTFTDENNAVCRDRDLSLPVAWLVDPLFDDE
jgi:hypothetical protein